MSAKAPSAKGLPLGSRNSSATSLIVQCQSPLNWRPQCEEDLIGRARFVAKVQLSKAARLAPSASVPYKLLLYGPPGTGKTTLAELIAAKLTGNAMAVESFNGKEITVDTVRGWMDTLPYGSLFSRWSVKIVNEFDRCSKDAQDLMLSYLDRLPPGKGLIGTSNLQLELMTERLQTRFPAQRIDGPTQDEVAELLALRWPIPRDIANSLAFSCGGCVRAALADAENWLDEQGVEL